MARTKNTSSSPVMELLKRFFNHYIVKNILILVLIGFFVYYGTLVILRHYTHHGETWPVPDLTNLTLTEAGEILSAQKMRWQLVDSVYVTSARPGVVVNQNPEPGFKVKENRNIFLTINAHAPEKVKMPDVVGVSYRQAKTILESQGLTTGKLSYMPDIAKDNVLKQTYRGKEIKKGTTIVKGSEIDLVLGRGLSDEKTTVPNLLGMHLTDAREELTKYSLNIGVVIYDDSVGTGADSVKAFIWKQRPEADIDAMLRLGSAVDVYMTVDEEKNVTIIPEKGSE